jgi:hypothetical protein
VGADYTFVDALARDFPAPDLPAAAPAQVGDLALALGRDRPLDLADPAIGTAVKTARSSWVRRVTVGSFDYFVKTYIYRTTWERLRGALRNTGPHNPGRAAREAAALAWLRQHGFSVPPVIGVVEQRRHGLLAVAILVTGAWPGESLDQLLPRLPRADCERLAAAVGEFVAALHGVGFRDGNLDLRNLLAARVGDRFALTKIDSPRFRIVRPGNTDDRRARADWARLLPQLAAFGLDAIARAAAAACSATPAPRRVVR